MYKTIMFLVFFIAGNSLLAQNVFDSTHTRQFLQFLMQTKQYNFAQIEAERLYFFTQTDTLFALQLRLNRYLKTFDEGIFKFNNYTVENKQITKDIYEEYLKLLICKQQLTKVKSSLNQSLLLDSISTVRYLIHTALLEKNWNQAKLLYNTFPGSKLLAPYDNYINKGSLVKLKNPVIATGLSVIVPGLGKVYSGFPRDGLFALAAIATTAWQAYNGFSRKGNGSVYGWFFASFSGVLYVSTIYGSYKSAKQINYFNEEKVIHTVNDLLN